MWLPPAADCLVAALLGALLAGGLWLIAVDASARTRDLQTRGVVTTAEVLATQLAGRGSPEGADVRFTTEDGATVDGFARGVDASAPVGSDVEVVYDPLHPDRIIAADERGEDGLAVVLGGFAVLATLLPVAALVTALWRAARVARWRRARRAGASI